MGIGVPFSLYSLHGRSHSVTDILDAMRCSLVQGMKTPTSFWLKAEYYLIKGMELESRSSICFNAEDSTLNLWSVR